MQGALAHALERAPRQAPARGELADGDKRARTQEQARAGWPFAIGTAPSSSLNEPRRDDVMVNLLEKLRSREELISNLQDEIGRQAQENEKILLKIEKQQHAEKEERHAWWRHPIESRLQCSEQWSGQPRHDGAGQTHWSTQAMSAQAVLAGHLNEWAQRSEQAVSAQAVLEWAQRSEQAVSAQAVLAEHL